MASQFGTGGTWWVRQQHEDITVLHQDSAPEGGIVPGQRAVRIYGPFATQQAADAFAKKEYAQTLSGQHGRGR